MKTVCAVMVAIAFALAAFCLRSESQKAKFRVAVNNLEVDRTHLEDERDALRRKLAAQKTSLEILAKEKADLKDDINGLEDDKKRLAEENSFIRQDVTHYANKKYELETTCSQLTAEIASLTNQCNDLRKKLAIKHEEYEQINKRYRYLHRRLLERIQ